jgi:prepilin-type N-terminal cleavage/methylation domain-containing protein
VNSRIRQYQEHGSEGFTLIELLIVIIIIGILAAIVVFSVSGVNNTAAKNSCQQNVNELNTAIEAYYASNSKYPATEADLIPGFLKTSVQGSPGGIGLITFVAPVGTAAPVVTNAC